MGEAGRASTFPRSSRLRPMLPLCPPAQSTPHFQFSSHAQPVPVTVDMSDAADMPTLSDLLSCQSMPVTVDVSDAADMPSYTCHSWCKQR